MGFFDWLKRPDIDAGAAQFARTPGAVLLDVRTPEEYAGGHIPGSRNLPLDRLDGVGKAVPDRDTPIFVCCLSGARSRRAAVLLGRMGYAAVTDIGGIGGYHGRVER